MTRAIQRSIISVVCLWWITTAATAANFTPISLTSFANDQLGFINSAYPTGNLTLGGVPFNIPTTGNNIYFSHFGANQGPGTATLVVPINISGVSAVDTLINSAWGQPGPTSLASLTFTYSDSTTYLHPLFGNQDIRDCFSGGYTNSINGTTTANVFATTQVGNAGPGEYRLDKQLIDLSAFTIKTLTSVTLTDSGNAGVQRSYLFGLTVETVPEPASVLLIASLVVPSNTIRLPSCRQR